MGESVGVSLPATTDHHGLLLRSLPFHPVCARNALPSSDSGFGKGVDLVGYGSLDGSGNVLGQLRLSSRRSTRYLHRQPAGSSAREEGALRVVRRGPLGRV